MAYPSPWLAARPPGTAQKKDAGRGGVRSPARRPGPWRTLFRIGTGPSACARPDEPLDGVPVASRERGLRVRRAGLLLVNGRDPTGLAARAQAVVVATFGRGHWSRTSLSGREPGALTSGPRLLTCRPFVRPWRPRRQPGVSTNEAFRYHSRGTGTGRGRQPGARRREVDHHRARAHARDGGHRLFERHPQLQLGVPDPRAGRPARVLEHDEGELRAQLRREHRVLERDGQAAVGRARELARAQVHDDLL